MTHKQAELRWRLKYEFIERKLIRVLRTIEPYDIQFIQNSIRQECEGYLEDQGLTYPTKASDK